MVSRAKFDYGFESGAVHAFDFRDDFTRFLIRFWKEDSTISISFLSHFDYSLATNLYFNSSRIFGNLDIIYAILGIGFFRIYCMDTSYIYIVGSDC